MIQLSKHLKAVNQGDNDSIVYTGTNNGTATLLFNGSGISIDGVTISKIGIVGSPPVPLTRTNNPIGLTNDVNENISLLDYAIGEDGDMTENSNTQLKVISRANTVIENLDYLNTRKSVNTVKVRIGGLSVPNCDFNFATEAGEGMTEQVFTFTTLPALARILEVMTHTSAVFTGASTLVAEIGTTSSGHEIMNSTTVYAANVINVVAADHAVATGTPIATTLPLYIAITPGAPWHHCTAGTLDVYVTYIDVDKIVHEHHA